MNATDEVTKVSLDEHVELVARYRELKKYVEEFEEVKKKLKDLAGNADEILIGGMKVATNTKSVFAESQFKKQYRHLWDEFAEPQVSMKLNRDRLRAKHGWLVDEFTSRSLRFES